MRSVETMPAIASGLAKSRATSALAVTCGTANSATLRGAPFEIKDRTREAVIPDPDAWPKRIFAFPGGKTRACGGSRSSARGRVHHAALTLPFSSCGTVATAAERGTGLPAPGPLARPIHFLLAGSSPHIPARSG